MKKTFMLFLISSIICVSPLNAQLGRVLNKVSKSVANEVDRKTDSGSSSEKQQPEPKCACDQPQLIFDLGGNLKLMYSEITLNMKDDGSILVKDQITGNYYIAKDGTTEGPIKEGDHRLTGFDNSDDRDKPKEKSQWANNEYISKSGDKFQIKFGGKTYGPYGEIREFQVSRSKQKFAAMVVETVLATEDEGKKIEEAIKNAKTDQERMDLSMKYSQQMMQKMQAGGGPMSTMPKLVTNIAGASYDPLKSAGGMLNGNIKYDDILFLAYDKVIDLSNKVLLTIKPEDQSAGNLFVNTGNTKYAFYNYGTLKLSDGTTLSELFGVRWVKENGQVSLAYMYYSPKRNAIMQCKLAF